MKLTVVYLGLVITLLPSTSLYTPLTVLTCSNLSNAASLLWHALHALPAPSSHTNWAGFYVLDPSSPTNQLILGPFQGKVACQTIRFGRGVCGTAASTKTTQLVADVEEFPGHIACDAESASEIVVPILQDGKVSFLFSLFVLFLLFLLKCLGVQCGRVPRIGTDKVLGCRYY